MFCQTWHTPNLLHNPIEYAAKGRSDFKIVFQEARSASLAPPLSLSKKARTPSICKIPCQWDTYRDHTLLPATVGAMPLSDA